MIDRHTLEKLFNMRPEWLNERMATEIDSAYGEGWNACNKVWLANLVALLKEVDKKLQRRIQMMRLINADSLKELYEGFGEYEDSLVVPIAVILQNIDDMPTIAIINESAFGKPLKDE